MRRRRLTTAEPGSLRLDEPTRRVNITLLESQHEELSRRNVNLSGLIRELLDAHLSQHMIVLRVDEDTRRLYDEVMSGTGFSEDELSHELKRVLAQLLDKKVAALTKLRKTLDD